MAHEQNFDQDPERFTLAGEVIDAAEAMSDDELDAAIHALTAREWELLVDGNVAAAKAVAHDKWVCISVRTNRAGQP